jgi:hypothetical protein
LRVLIIKVDEVNGILQVKASINGAPYVFAVPVGTSYGQLRTYITDNIVDEPLPNGWLREFDV